ncbi:hypothetical protein JYU34_012903 [Plutella xylostella]|uniref:Uncharacterized protein n=1 Tax=Plutella xylostella TaxID=51655 RepID=A0ABQ7QCF2_PLUXY|nr:hypothetical protein JYU34_012903 [Plutella xylostella]
MLSRESRGAVAVERAAHGGSAGELTGEGYVTAQHLAQAWRQRYPGILTDNRHDYLVSGEMAS